MHNRSVNTHTSSSQWLKLAVFAAFVEAASAGKNLDRAAREQQSGDTAVQMVHIFGFTMVFMMVSAMMLGPIFMRPNRAPMQRAPEREQNEPDANVREAVISTYDSIFDKYFLDSSDSDAVGLSDSESDARALEPTTVTKAVTAKSPVKAAFFKLPDIDADISAEEMAGSSFGRKRSYNGE